MEAMEAAAAAATAAAEQNIIRSERLGGERATSRLNMGVRGPAGHKQAVQREELLLSVDAMEAAVDLVSLYNLDELPGELAEQVEVLQRAAELTAEAMPRLRTLNNLADYWIEINRLENQADELHRAMVAELFNNATDAVYVIKLKGIIDGFEDAADAFEKVAHVVEGIAVKES